MSRKPIEPGSPPAGIVAEEQGLLARVTVAVAHRGRGEDEPQPGSAYDQELLSLRDQIGEAKPEDVAPLVEQMARVAALAAGRRREVSLPVDPASPYFAHLRLREGGDAGHPNGKDGKPATDVRWRDILIGRRGFIDRASGVQIVDWRDAPVSQIYYRFDEGDDYDEVVDARHLAGVVEARRNLTIHRALLRRIGCPQGVFVASGEGQWFEAEGFATPTLAGGSGKAARPPRPASPPARREGRRSLGVHSGPVPRADKQLPEIAALIDPAQFDLITGGGGGGGGGAGGRGGGATGLVVIQGGAGSGKTTVALHRVAWLVFHDPHHFRPSRCLLVVPSRALERYVSGVLPALGVRGVPVVTFHGWARATRRKVLPHVPDRYTEETPPAVARVKKHPAMLGLLAGEVERRTRAAGQELLAAPRGAEARAQVTWAWEEGRERPPLERIAGLSRWLRGETGAALEGGDRQRIELALGRIRRRLRDLRTMFAELLTDSGRLRAGLPGDGPDAVRDDDVQQVVEWVAAQQEEQLESEHADVDLELRTPVDGGDLDDSARGIAAGKLDAEDDALLLRLAQLLHGGLVREADREAIRYDHIAIDEAQDLSAVEIRVLLDAAVAQRGGERSITLCGDVAQRLVFDNAFHGWAPLLADVGLAGAPVRPLHLSYRSTEEVMLFARAVLGELAHEEEVAARPGAPVELLRFDAMGEAVGFLAETLRSLAGREPTASVALISRYPAQADAWHQALTRAEVPSLRRVRRQDFPFVPGVDVTDVTQVKGLEFDYIVLLDVTPANYPATVEARHLLHIGATRAAHQLWLIALGTPSPLLPDSLLASAAPEAS